MKPTLLILAAGMGSRYGGIKQLDTIGPSGETIMDYSVYDAMRAGFGKVVFIIRKSIEEPFCDIVLRKYQQSIPCEYVFQEVDKLPVGYQPPEGRQKPWGTGHAILMAADVIKEPFAVINADDFYGRDAFLRMGRFLQNTDMGSSHWAMIGYRLANTLSDFGFVSRGVCCVDGNNMLVNVTERTKIKRTDWRLRVEARNDKVRAIVYQDENSNEIVLNEDLPVSMNFWGFTPSLFTCLKSGFENFLKINKESLTAEYYIPSEVSRQIDSKNADVQVIPTTSNWFGITYAEEKTAAAEQIKVLVEVGGYPMNCF
ncbi:MAG: nucleotidyltransferase [Bacteroidales bacterium]|jgi:UTP-glucose-1-phosphate uridylyltransferase|nr:nucleotidyltransferase [Bacteroidales bacterium]